MGSNPRSMLSQENLEIRDIDVGYSKTLKKGLKVASECSLLLALFDMGIKSAAKYVTEASLQFAVLEFHSRCFHTWLGQ